MLEWMIAIVALCGAIAGFAAIYLVLRVAMQAPRGGDPDARERAFWRRRRRDRLRDRDRDRDWLREMARLEELLPRARVHRWRESTGRRRKAVRATG